MHVAFSDQRYVTAHQGLNFTWIVVEQIKNICFFVTKCRSCPRATGIEEEAKMTHLMALYLESLRGTHTCTLHNMHSLS